MSRRNGLLTVTCDAKDVMKILTRRSFLLQSTVVPALAALGNTSYLIPSSRERTVTAFAQIGSLHPSRTLLSNLLARELNDTLVVVKGERESGRREDRPTIVEFARAFPGAHIARENGLLQPRYRELLVENIRELLGHGYEQVNLEISSDPSFWYPFVSDPVVCCRLSLRNSCDAQS